MIGMSAKVSGLCGLWEGTMKYSRNTPNELAFMIVCMGSAEPIGSLGGGVRSGGGRCTSTSFAFESHWFCAQYCWLRWTGIANVGKKSWNRAGSRRLRAER